MTEQAIEQEIQEKGLNAPRLTPENIDATIVGEQYFVFPGTTVTICLLTLANGFTVTGESACASPENFDEEIGRKIARTNARDKIWMLEGYLLKDKLHNGEQYSANNEPKCFSSQVLYSTTADEKDREKSYMLLEAMKLPQINPDLRADLEKHFKQLVNKIFN